MYVKAAFFKEELENNKEIYTAIWEGFKTKT